MSEEQGHITTGSSGSPRWVGLAVAVLAAISLIALGIGWSAARRARNAEQGLKTEVTTLQQTGQALSQRLAQSEEANSQVQNELSVVTGRLKLTQGELSRSRWQSKKLREEYQKQLADMGASVKSELAQKANTEDVNAVSTDVKNVKSDLEATKQNLQMARGELGTLIARNHDEIDQLRRLGQRDYFEFTLARKGARQKVGDITVELRGTNTKKHLFTMRLYVDDMRLEKKNRSINEPIYFYTRSSRTPLELVVNQVGKNRVVGYVSVPKANPTTAAGS